MSQLDGAGGSNGVGTREREHRRVPRSKPLVVRDRVRLILLRTVASPRRLGLVTATVTMVALGVALYFVSSMPAWDAALCAVVVGALVPFIMRNAERSAVRPEVLAARQARLEDRIRRLEGTEPTVGPEHDSGPRLRRRWGVLATSVVVLMIAFGLIRFGVYGVVGSIAIVFVVAAVVPRHGLWHHDHLASDRQPAPRAHRGLDGHLGD